MSDTAQQEVITPAAHRAADSLSVENRLQRTASTYAARLIDKTTGLPGLLSALGTIAELPIPEQDNMVAANMRAIAVAAIGRAKEAWREAERQQFQSLQDAERFDGRDPNDQSWR